MFEREMFEERRPSCLRQTLYMLTNGGYNKSKKKYGGKEVEGEKGVPVDFMF